MAKVECEVSCQVPRSFRVDQVAGMFDVELAERSRRSWSIELPDLEDGWTIGAIVGPSGSGKSCIARQHYADGFVERYDWPADVAIVDAFPEDLSVKVIVAMLNAVGFSSPPDWVKPYAALSNGQRFRGDLARALLTPAEVVAFDEFSSVVDRQVAQFGSAAVAKALRAGRTLGHAKRFVAVTCHYDVLDWLSPDLVLDLGAGGKLARGWLQRDHKRFEQLVHPRPSIDIDLRFADRSAWGTFKHHHYLSHQLASQARCYVGWWANRPVAFAATLQSFGHARRRAIHRLVVLPDYQGMGIGLRVLEAVSAWEARTHTVAIRTSHPALITSLRHRAGWVCTDFQVSGAAHNTRKSGGAVRSGSRGRSVATFRWVGHP